MYINRGLRPPRTIIIIISDLWTLKLGRDFAAK